MSPPGPFETEAQARQLPAVRAVYAAFDADPGPGKMTPHILRMLLDALAAAGVYLGPYDHQIAAWLANWEPPTVAVIAGWVLRASQADELLGRMRDGPPAVTPGGRHNESSKPPRPKASADGIIRPGGDSAPREAAP